MGLDMYLYARMGFKPNSEVRAIFDRIATDDEKEQAHGKMVTGDDGKPAWEEGYAYASGWSFPARPAGKDWNGNPTPEVPARPPSDLYVALSEKVGIQCHEGSPHIDIQIDRHGDLLLDFTIFYWRKANAIHNWFVQYAQNGEDDCGQYEVHPELLLDLVDRCERVTVDHDQAADLLETKGGFFFGSTDYGEWYFENVEDTAVNLKAALQPLMPLGPTLMYHSSW